MNAVWVVASVRQRYDGRWYNEGQVFQVASEDDAADLIALSFATKAKEQSQLVTETTVITPETRSPSTRPRSKRESKRRDITVYETK